MFSLNISFILFIIVAIFETCSFVSVTEDKYAEVDKDFAKCCRDNKVTGEDRLKMCSYSGMVTDANKTIAEYPSWNYTLGPEERAVDNNDYKEFGDILYECATQSRNVTDCCLEFGIPKICSAICDATYAVEQGRNQTMIPECNTYTWQTYAVLAYAFICFSEAAVAAKNS